MPQAQSCSRSCGATRGEARRCGDSQETPHPLLIAVREKQTNTQPGAARQGERQAESGQNPAENIRLVSSDHFERQGEGAEQQPSAKTCPHHISSHCPQQSGAVPHGNTDAVATYLPKPSLLRGMGWRSDKSAREHPWKETSKREVYLLYSSRKLPHL